MYRCPLDLHLNSWNKQASSTKCMSPQIDVYYGMAALNVTKVEVRVSVLQYLHLHDSYLQYSLAYSSPNLFLMCMNIPVAVS